MRWGRAARAALAMAAVGVSVAGCQPATQGWRSALVSVNAEGVTASNSISEHPVFSPDGTKIAFVSSSSDLGPPDTNIHRDIYLRDLATGEVTLISMNGAGTDAGNGDSFNPVFSPDGTKIAFVSQANDLGPLDSARPSADDDVYVRDLGTDITTLVSVSAAGAGSGNWGSIDPIFNPVNSDQLVFTSGASNLVGAADGSNTDDLYLRDLAAGTTVLLSVEYSPTIGHFARDAAFSPDGRLLAFEAVAQLVPGFVRVSGPDIFVRDMQTGVISAVSWNMEHTRGADSGSEDPVFGPDGTLLAFTSYASDLAGGDVDGPGSYRDIFVRDLTTETTTLASIGEESHADLPTFSPDGRWLAYDSGLAGIERVGGALQVTRGPEPPGGFESPAFSPDGGTVLFRTWESLDPRDRNIVADVYLFDIGSGDVDLVSANDAQTGSGSDISGAYVDPSVFSPDGTRIAFESRATDLTSHAHPEGSWYTDIFVAHFVPAFDRTDLVLEAGATPTTVHTGDDVTYEVTVTNGGPAAAENVSVAFLKPPGLAPGTISITAGTCGQLYDDFTTEVLQCDLGTVPPGASVQLTVKVGVTAEPGSTLLAAASAHMGPTLESDAQDNAHTMTVTVD